MKNQSIKTAFTNLLLALGAGSVAAVFAGFIGLVTLTTLATGAVTLFFVAAMMLGGLSEHSDRNNARYGV